MSTEASPFESLFTEDLYLIPGHVLIVIDRPWTSLREEDVTVLTKMLAALKLTLGKVQIVEKASLTVNDLLPYDPSRVLVFGSTMSEMSNLYASATINNVQVILSESLDRLDDAKKKSLWAGLRPMFGV